LLHIQVFELNPWRAWGAVVTSILSFALAEYLISISPWYLLPFAWAFAGTAFTGVSELQAGQYCVQGAPMGVGAQGGPCCWPATAAGRPSPPADSPACRCMGFSTVHLSSLELRGGMKLLEYAKIMVVSLLP
jgi:hypothetical protein